MKHQTYLEKVETFGHFELSMITNCLFFFNDEFIEIHHKKIIDKLAVLSSDRLFKDSMTNYLNNLIVIGFERENIRMIKSGLEKLKDAEQSDEKAIFTRLIYRFFTAMYQELFSKKEFLQIATFSK